MDINKAEAIEDLKQIRKTGEFNMFFVRRRLELK